MSVNENTLSAWQKRQLTMFRQALVASKMEWHPTDDLMIVDAFGLRFHWIGMEHYGVISVETEDGESVVDLSYIYIDLLENTAAISWWHPWEFPTIAQTQLFALALNKICCLASLLEEKAAKGTEDDDGTCPTYAEDELPIEFVVIAPRKDIKGAEVNINARKEKKQAAELAALKRVAERTRFFDYEWEQSLFLIYHEWLAMIINDGVSIEAVVEMLAAGTFAHISLHDLIALSDKASDHGWVFSDVWCDFMTVARKE